MGHGSDALRDLSGAPTFYIDLKDKQMMRNKIEMAFATKSALVIASKKDIVNPTISAKHSYNILRH
jgi:hypothetical protein